MERETLIARLVDGYRRDHVSDTRRAGVAEVRAAMNFAREQFGSTAALLEQMMTGFAIDPSDARRSRQHDAASVINALGAENALSFLDTSTKAIHLLRQLEAAAKYAIKETLKTTKRRHSAARNAAMRIWVWSEPLGIKASTSINGKAVALLVKVAWCASEHHLTDEAAQAALKEVRAAAKSYLDAIKKG